MNTKLTEYMLGEGVITPPTTPKPTYYCAVCGAPNATKKGTFETVTSYFCSHNCKTFYFTKFHATYNNVKREKYRMLLDMPTLSPSLRNLIEAELKCVLSVIANKEALYARKLDVEIQAAHDSEHATAVKYIKEHSQ